MKNRNISETGFTLVEALIALLIMCFGLLAAGQLIFVAAGSGSLSRSKDAATVAAQNKIEFLTNLYNRDPASGDLTDGAHGPEQVQVLDQGTNRVLNRFNVTWTVATVPDPRTGKTLRARQIFVTVTPINASGNRNVRSGLNKIVTMTAILSGRLT